MGEGETHGDAGGEGVSDEEGEFPPTPRQPQSEQEPPADTAPDMQAALLAISTRLHRGPLPDPNDLERYAQIIPNGAERIVRMAEKQSDHRMELERFTITHDSRRADWGVICAFIITLVDLGCGTIVAVHGQAVAGVIVMAGGVSMLVGTFIYGTNNRRREREVKAARMAQLETPRHDSDD